MRNNVLLGGYNRAANHAVHAKDGIRCLQMETTLAVLGDGGRYPIARGMIRCHKTHSLA